MKVHQSRGDEGTRSDRRWWWWTTSGRSAAPLSGSSPAPLGGSDTSLARRALYFASNEEDDDRLARATLIDGTGAPPVRDATIVVQDGRIESIATGPGGAWPSHEVI